MPPTIWELFYSKSITGAPLRGKGFWITLEESSSASIENSLSYDSKFAILVFLLLKSNY